MAPVTSCIARAGGVLLVVKYGISGVGQNSLKRGDGIEYAFHSVICLEEVFNFATDMQLRRRIRSVRCSLCKGGC